MTFVGAELCYSRYPFPSTCLFFLITRLFVVLYEEPTLRRTFGDEEGCSTLNAQRSTSNAQHPTSNDSAAVIDRRLQIFS
jgi:hypothetical protein